MTLDRAPLAIVARLAMALAIAGLLGMAVVEGWQVFARYVLNDSPSWTEPVALLCMSTTMMMGAAVGTRREAHFGFYILSESLAPAVGAALRTAVRLLIALLGLLLAVFGTQLMWDAWWYDMAGVALPQGIVYLPISIGGALIALFAIERIFVQPAAESE